MVVVAVAVRYLAEPPAGGECDCCDSTVLEGLEHPAELCKFLRQCCYAAVQRHLTHGAVAASFCDLICSSDTGTDAAVCSNFPQAACSEEYTHTAQSAAALHWAGFLMRVLCCAVQNSKHELTRMCSLLVRSHY